MLSGRFCFPIDQSPISCLSVFQGDGKFKIYTQKMHMLLVEGFGFTVFSAGLTAPEVSFKFGLFGCGVAGFPAPAVSFKFGLFGCGVAGYRVLLFLLTNLRFPV